MLRRDGEVTLIGCPACAGVLSALTEGREDFVRYVCTVGHSFSVSGLIDAKEEQLEHGMWAVMSILAHLDMAYHDLLEQSRTGVMNVRHDDIAGRIQQVREYAEVVRDLIERDRRPALQSGEPQSEPA